MEFVGIIAGVWLVHLAAVISPGPSLVVVARTALAGSRVAGAWTAIGLGIGTFVWASAALFGLKAVFAAVPWLYASMKLAGAAYLFYLAIQLWRHADAPLDVAGTQGGTALARGAALRQGVFTQLSNPKVAVFFGSIFVTLLPADASWGLTLTLLGIVCLNETAWYLFVAYAITTRPLAERYARAKATVDRLTGGVLAGLGLKLVLDR